MYEHQGSIASFFESNGYPAPDNIILDGKWRDLKFSDGRKIGYVGCVLSTGNVVCTIRDRKLVGSKKVYRSWLDGKGEFTTQDLREYREKRREADQKAKIARKKAQTSFKHYLKFGDAGVSDYLKRKKLPPYSAHPGHHQTVVIETELSKKDLVIGAYDEDGELGTYQTITGTGQKLFCKGAKSQGLYFDFLGVGDKWALTEGWADGYAVFLSTGWNVRVAFSLGQLKTVLKKMIKQGIEASNITLCADCDGNNWRVGATNPGFEEALKLGEFGVKIAIPSRDCGIKRDFCDLWTEGGGERVRLGVEEALEPGEFGEWFLREKGYVTSARGEGEEKTQGVENVSGPGESLGDGSGPGEREPLDVVGLGIVRTVGGANAGDKSGGSYPLQTLGGTSGEQGKSVPYIEGDGDLRPELFKNLKTPGGGDVSGPLVKKVVSKWEPKTFDIKTREAGFWIVIPPTDKREKEKWIPDYQGLRDYFDELYIYKSTMGKYVWKWNGKFFEEVEPGELKAFAETQFNPKPLEKVRSEFCHKITANNYVTRKFFKVARKVNFQNGWLDLDKMEFRQHSPEVGFQNVLGYDFDESARCPVWDRFLDQVMCGDEELAQVVNEYIGYILSGDELWFQKALMLKGEGSNGKSTLLDLVRDLIGRENATAHSLDTLNKDKSSIAGLEGKLANISDETPKDALLEGNTFKLLSAGGTISARKLYGDFFEFQNSAKFVFSANDFGGTKDQSHAFWRRLIIVPFEQTFDDNNRDPMIGAKLLRELPGIFNKTVSLYLKAKERRAFTTPKSSAEQMKAYQLESNPVLQWLEDEVEIHEKGSPGWEIKSSIAAVYAAFRRHAQDRGHQNPLSEANFSKALRRGMPDQTTAKERFGRFYFHKKDKTVKQDRGVLGLSCKAQNRAGKPFDTDLDF